MSSARYTAHVETIIHLIQDTVQDTCSEGKYDNCGSLSQYLQNLRRNWAENFTLYVPLKTTSHGVKCGDYCGSVFQKTLMALARPIHIGGGERSDGTSQSVWNIN